MTQKDVERFNIKEKLAMCEKELHDIELTADKSKRLRWRELNKLIRYYKSILL